MNKERMSKLYESQHWAFVTLLTGVWLTADGVQYAPIASAQIAGDRTFNTLVNGSLTEACSSAVCTIEGGLQNTAGSALLHSFDSFSLPTPEQSAVFVDPSVENILVRVTGGADSLINGAIGTSAGSEANLFLINPSGIHFGPAAQLNIGGSFVASTAQQLIFDDGTLLATGAASQPTDALLSISAPIGLGFLPQAERASANGESLLDSSITLQGPGHFLTFGAPDTPSAFVNRIFQPGGGLSVRSGEAVVLVGDGIQSSGGAITAAGGQIAVGSVSSGRVLLSADPSAGLATGLDVDYSQVERYADITLRDRTLLETSAAIPGEIGLRGQNVAIIDSSAVLSESLESGLVSTADSSSGVVDVRAVETVRVSGFDLGFGSESNFGSTFGPAFGPTAPPFHSYLSVDVGPGAAHPGGILSISAGSLLVDTGGQLGANTFGLGDAGRLDLQIAGNTTLEGGSLLGPSGLFATADSLGQGRAGDITLRSRELEMSQGATILTSSLNPAAAGSISIEAARVSLSGTSTLALPPNVSPPDVSSPDVLPPDVLPSDVPPMVEMTAPTAPIVRPTLIQSGMGAVTRGQGGGISIRTNALSVTDGAEISTGTFGAGDAGAIEIDAETVSISGFSPVEGPSGLFTVVGLGAAGAGGALSIETGEISISNGAQVSTSTAGVGDAGDLTVRAGRVNITDQTVQGRSGLFATAVGDRGAGGNLTIEANELSVENGAAVSVSNFLSQTSDDAQILPGQGAAGNLQIEAERISLQDGGLLSADTAAGDRGSILLETNLITLRRGGSITTNATGSATGGNIAIEATDFVVAVPEENSDITANAVFGDGGRVTIAARQVLGLQAQPRVTAQSDITASSAFGLSGETQIETFDSEVRPDVESLPQVAEVPDVLQGCSSVSAGRGRFVQSGQGGIASSPYGLLSRQESLADVSVPASIAEDNLGGNGLRENEQTEDKQVESVRAESGRAESEQPLEAQGWGVSQTGEVVLAASLSAGGCVL